MRSSVFILSQPKTATQSLFRSLKEHKGPTVFHAHTLDVTNGALAETSWLAKLDSSTVERWAYKIRKETGMLRALLDARQMKTVVAVRRDANSRLCSELFYSHFGLIAPHYDGHTDTFDRSALERALDQQHRRAMSKAASYAERVYAPLGIAPSIVESGHGVIRIRDDLEVAVLRFDALADDYSDLLNHLGLPPVPLAHENPARDRSRDIAGERPHADAATTSMYRAFKRDYLPSLSEADSDLGGELRLLRA